MKKIIVFIVIVLGISFGVYFGYTNFFTKDKVDNKESFVELKQKFNGYGMVSKETSLYKKIDNSYQKVGTVSINTEFKLTDSDNKYFKINDISYYVDANDLEPIDEVSEINNRYKDYVVFNTNITTKNNTSFYDENDKLIYTIEESFDFPVIIKDTNRYAVEFNNNLYYIKKDNVEKEYENDNTDVETRENIRTFTYHTVYDPVTEKCTSIEICHTISQFESHMKYLSDNKFLTLTMEELEMFLDKKIRIPKNTVVITLDDGIYLDNSIPLVEKYKIHATFFIITSKVDVTKYFNSKYARFESHTDNLHNNYKCALNKPTSQGGQMLCEKHDNIVADLKLSQDKLDESYYFAYPFFDYNDNAIKALKDAGFKMAFIGQFNTNGYSDFTTDRYLLRRKTIFGNLSMKGFIDYLV